MTSTVTAVSEKLHKVELSFTNEGVPLTVSRNVSGSQETALAYVPTLERDTRANYAEMFPLPTYEPAMEDEQE